VPVTDFDQRVGRHFASAKALQAEGRLAEAAQEWVAGLQIVPRSKSAYLSLADALLQLKLFQPASIACRQALLMAPGDREISQKLAAALRAEGQLESARNVLQSLCAANSRDWGSRFLLAGILADMGQEQQAIRHLQQAISLQPRFPEASNNLALLLRAAGETSGAEAQLRKALAIRPDYAAAWNNLGNLCVELSRTAEAADCYSKAISIDPEYAEAHTNRALVSLLHGNFEEGWREYEWRWKQPGAEIRTLPRPAWDGSLIAGKTILLHSEQGAGDTIQFVRYAKMAADRGLKVTLEVQEPLVRLLTGLPGIERIIAAGSEIPPYDVRCSLLSLPRIFKTDLASIPGDTPYLSADPAPVAGEGLKKIGIAWRGNPNHLRDRKRSLSLAWFLDVLDGPGIELVSLQTDFTWAEFPKSRDKSRFVEAGRKLADFADTAALIAGLDLVVAVDTSVCHLAGALGKPVWTLIDHASDWRWLTERSDTPWYPTMRLFRQDRPGDWSGVAARVRDALVQQLGSALRVESIHR